MTRLSGIQLLALSIVLWALAVWLFDAPHPAEAEPTAPTETTARTSGKTKENSEADAREAARGETTTASASGAVADRGGATPSDPGTEVASPPPRAASEGTGIETGSVTASGGASESPAAGTPTPAVASGDGSQVALAPARAGGDAGAGTTTVPRATGPESGGGPGGSGIPGSPVPDGAAGIAGWPGAPPAPSRPPPWFEHPLSRPIPPPGSDFSAANGNPVEAQLNAARRAAWEGRFADALAHYRAAARLRPNDYVVWGEMGNVLWTMQRWSEAAYALEGAATLLVRAGELRAASELVPAVGRLNPDAAYRVQRLLWAAAQRQSG